MVVATFRSVIDMTVNNSYQIYWQSHLNPGKYTLNAVGFRQAMVDAYYRLYRKSLPSITLFKSSCSYNHPANNMQFDSFNHRIAKSSQRQCVAYQDVKKPLYILAKNSILSSCWMFWIISLKYFEILLIK